MDKRTIVSKIAQTEEDRFLFSKIYDKLTTAEQRNILGCTGFLSPREQVLTSQMLQGMPLHYFGGHCDAERAICCWLPDYYDEGFLASEDGPIAVIRADYYAGDKLTHRDFLGSLMGCGLKRETIGDIYVSDGQCDILLLRDILPYVLDNFLSAGRTKVTVCEIPLNILSVPQKTVKQIRDTVSSLRLDCIAGSGFGLSRGKACELIASGKVSVNDLPCMKPDKLLQEGDRVTARGYGKLVFLHVQGRTKKDRVSILLERYV